MSDSCYSSGDTLLSVDEAQTNILDATKSIERTEIIALDQALGRILAEDITSPINVPDHDNSAMDGYVLCASDITENQQSLPISQRITAGHPGQPLKAGTCARIFTGAVMPTNADTVVMQELTKTDGDKISFPYPTKVNENIRPRANDIAIGDQVLQKGERLKAPHIGLLASLGIAKVSVYCTLKVAILNTGDEIVEPGNKLKPGQIYNTNRYSLTATLKQLGCQVIDLGQVEDTYEATESALLNAAKEADLIITSGGVSVGEEDHVKAAVVAQGALNLWRIRLKPGKPFAFGKVESTPFIGLPGNPVSAMVTFMLLGRLIVLKAMGVSSVFPKTQQVAINFDWTKEKPRREFIRVQVDHNVFPPLASSFPRQGSDVFSSIVWADGLVEIPEHTSFNKGDLLKFYPFNELLS